ncbi:abortive infection family protein [Methylocaldum sp.]|uniref:abortive infection family protein n=1 Tax=Methylocaldum sp. TaxID=1969727 RepID=UPI002D52BE0B|nr:abortive infection family protein [Methylocaldum sp.]HYE37086.1 abortive infection family protein [Methylocaldum sp.]
MTNLDALAPNYRRALERWTDAPTLSASYAALNACFEGNAHGLIEHIKSFIESVCVTILCEFGKSLPSSSPSTTDLLVASLQPLGLYNTKGASKLGKVLSGFNRLADALTEMRNDHGAVAHGKDAFIDAVAEDHARAFLHTGDAILSVILNALEGKEPDLSVTREPYERFIHHHERIDRAVGVEARIDEDNDGRSIIVVVIRIGPKEQTIEVRTEPSRLLFGIDRDTYIDILKTVVEVVPTLAEGKMEEPSAGEKPPELSAAHAGPPVIEVVPSYNGRFEIFRADLERFLSTEGWSPTEPRLAEANLTDSLLATMDQNVGVDWKQRGMLQARLKVACKRVLVQFGFDVEKVEEIAERLITWMRVQIPDSDEFQAMVTAPSPSAFN